MNKISNVVGKKSDLNRMEKFQAERLTAEEMYTVNGGMMASYTCGTVSKCHIDGTDDSD